MQEPGTATASKRPSLAPLIRSLVALAFVIMEAVMLPSILGNVILLFLAFILALRTLIDGIRGFKHGLSAWSFVGSVISLCLLLYIVFLRLLFGDVPFGYGP